MVKLCKDCGKPFEIKAPAQRYCDACWGEVKLVCQRCDKPFTLKVVGHRKKHRQHQSRRYCDQCVTELRTEHRRKVGGTGHRRVHKSGYVEINLGYQPAVPGVPMVGPSGKIVVPELKDGYVYMGRVKEHRWVMSQVMGRPLTEDEIVHHKNDNRQDNSPGNLEIWLVVKNHKGVRPYDLADWALDVLGRSEPAQLKILWAKHPPMT